MNMIVCRHPGDHGKYIFRLPDNCELDAGSLVKVKTKYGIQPAVCVTGSFRADPEVVCPLWGTTPKRMCRVLSYLNEIAIEWPDEPEPDIDMDDDDEP